jgi:hypothetical protein
LKVLLLNQFGAGSEAPTGRLADELAEFLNLHRHTARVISSNASYRVKRTGWRRWAHELRSHFILFFRAVNLGRADVVISFTSPVCLPVTARFAASFLHAKLYLWNMDLYPDLALALGELKPGLLASMLRSLMQGAYKSAAGVVALDDDMREFLQENYGVDSCVIPPWPPNLPWPASLSSATAGNKTWLYSGNLGQAHEIKTLLKIQQRLEGTRTDIQLVLQGGGAQWAFSQESARQLGLKNVSWRNPATESKLTESLWNADVLVVTRKPETKGLLWPSKLALAQLSSRPVLWIGDTDSRTAGALRAEPRNGVFAPGEVEQTARWLIDTMTATSHRPVLPLATETSRRENLQKWEALLTGTTVQ